MAGAQAFSNLWLASFQIHEFNLLANIELLTIGALQCRARQYDVYVSRNPMNDGFVKPSEPRLAVFIRQDNTIAHLFDVGRRMEGIGVCELPMKLLR